MATKGRIDGSETVTRVFFSNEYFKRLGITDIVEQAAKSRNYDQVYEALLSDAVKSRDTGTMQILTNEHLISVTDAGITFEATV